MLLDGGQTTYTLQAVLQGMPQREIVDKLVYRYFNSAENSIGLYMVMQYGYAG